MSCEGAVSTKIVVYGYVVGIYYQQQLCNPIVTRAFVRGSFYFLGIPYTLITLFVIGCYGATGVCFVMAIM